MYFYTSVYTIFRYHFLQYFFFASKYSSALLITSSSVLIFFPIYLSSANRKMSLRARSGEYSGRGSNLKPNSYNFAIVFIDLWHSFLDRMTLENELSVMMLWASCRGRSDTSGLKDDHTWLENEPLLSVRSICQKNKVYSVVMWYHRLNNRKIVEEEWIFHCAINVVLKSHDMLSQQTVTLTSWTPLYFNYFIYNLIIFNTYCISLPMLLNSTWRWQARKKFMHGH